MHLHWIDITIVLVYVGGTILVGVLSRGAIKGISDFLVAGRSLNIYMAVATYVATGLGLVTVMYFAEEGFKNGMAPFLVGVLMTLVFLVVGKTGFIVSRLRHLQVMTVPEFYELKYTRGVRLLGGLILAVAGTLNMGLFPILGSRFVVGFTGLPKESVNYVMLVMVAVVVFYTLMGGMVSVVLVDFIQFLLLTVGFAIGTWAILTHPDLGWTNIVDSLVAHKGPAAFDPIANPDYGWIFIIYFFSVGMIGIVWAPEMTHVLSTESPRVARRMFWIQGLTMLGRALIPMFWGAAAFVWVHLPTYAGPYAGDGRYAMPEMISQLLPIGVTGFLMAGMLAAFMSTHDSYLLAWSAVIVRDVVSPIKAMLAGSRQERAADGTWGGLTGEREIRAVRIAVVVIACFLVAFGAFYTPPETSMKYMYVTGTIYFAGCVGTIGLGLYWRRANTVGAYCALVMGAMGPIAFLILAEMPEVLPAHLRFLVENSNLSVMASLLLGGLGMVAGSLVSQRRHPPRALDFAGME
ncbi:MAG: sodium:solute symporter family protein [Gemmatimonadota bacterium]